MSHGPSYVRLYPWLSKWRWRLPHWRREVLCAFGRHEHTEIHDVCWCWYCGHTKKGDVTE